jgi:hypothetical protein
MSAMMNGKPLWCRPAPTKSGAIWSPEDTDEELVAISELPLLIERAIRAGLVQRPTAAEVIPPWRKNAIQKTCKKCGTAFWQAKSQKLVKCATCRIQPKNCTVCGKQFQPQQKKYLTCSEACAHVKRQEGVQRHAAEQWAKRPKLECPVCHNLFPLRFSGGRAAKTCGKVCGTEFFKRNAAAKREQRAANQTR